MPYDLIIIGGGPGGYVAAIRGGQLGLKVLLIEKEGDLGGTCLHRGCIPSKAYLAAAEVVERSRKGEKIGVSFAPPAVDFGRLVSSKDEKVKRLARGLKDLVRGNGVDLVQGKGEATLEEGRRIRLGEEIYEGRFVLLATGAAPVRPSLFPFDGRSVLTTDELFRMTELPQTMLVVGGGAIGCEMANAFRLLGAEVTLVEILPEILPNEEKSVSRGLRTSLERRGIRILTGVSVKEVEKGGRLVTAVLSDGQKLSTERILVAVGRRPEGGFVKVNERMETAVEGVYAVGDLVGATMLAHGAFAEGISVVENIVSERPRPVDYASIPRVVYTIPEVASVGRREDDLKEEGIAYRAGRFSYAASGKALCEEEGEGFAQVLVGTDGDRKGKILGASIFGARASELIHEAALAITNGLPVEALIRTVHAHPSLSEIVHEAAGDAEGSAIHKLGRKTSP